MTERWFKFLRTGRVGPFSGTLWPDAAWLTVQPPLAACRNGIHVSAVRDLPYWLNDELWEVEVEGEVIDHERKRIVERARLRTPVRWWPGFGFDLADACLMRLVNLTSAELVLVGHDGLPLQAGNADLARVVKAELTRDDARLSVAARALLRYLSDALEFRADTESGPAAAARHVSFVVAYAADHATRRPGQRLPAGKTPFHDERDRQAAWFATRLERG